ncbi:DnaT-like ssDNA-binding domain-containing protein, partial [Pontibacterium sp.]|uniref:DnaT-like ssDNA-binding domain-containing protein n=1 Tax=Pontibacterium sp. TaxID=2036026 RepID=UPI00356707BC
NKLLIQEAPLQVLPSLAAAIGLNEAIVLQQVHYWLSRSEHKYNGATWFYKTDEEFQYEFRFWSPSTFRRTLSSLKKLGLIRIDHLHGELKGDKFNRTKWYSINYAALTEIERKASSDASGQNDQIEVTERADASSQIDQLPSSQSEQMASGQNDQMLQENTTENTTESAREPEHPVFQQYEDDNQRMTLSWQYRENPFAERCLSMGVNLNTVNRTLITDALQGFRNYHEPKGRSNSQSGWESQFAMWLKKDIQRSKSAIPAAANGYSAPSAPPAWREFDFDQI